MIPMSYFIHFGKMELKLDWEKHYQPGCTVKITKLPPKWKLRGFSIDSEHTIQQPPKNKPVTGMGVWLKGLDGRLYYMPFTHFKTIKFAGSEAQTETNNFKRRRRN